MSFLDELAKILHLDIHDIITKKVGSEQNIKFAPKIKLGKNAQFKIEVHNTVEQLTINLDLSKLDSTERNSFAEAIRKEITEDKMQLLSVPAEQKKEVIKSNLPNKDDKEVLSFYADKLSPEYLEALELSIVTNHISDNSEDMLNMKADIIKLYPNFGRHLCLMVSAGYFHKDFMELYEQMKTDPDFETSKYRKEVELYVTSMPFTVFINRIVSEEEKRQEVERKLNTLLKKKLEILKSYGAPKLLLHGLGVDNVNTAKSILEKLKENPFVQDIQTESTNVYIRATIFLKPNTEK